MTILLTGSSGFIGSALVRALSGAGHRLVRLVRSHADPQAGRVLWDPSRGQLDTGALGAIDAAVHLAGESIVGRWTPARKRAILESRQRGTRLLAETLAALPTPPRVLVSASAIGYYGDRGEQWLTEQSASGGGFLAEVCRAWEAATEPAARRGVRVVLLRIGMVLGRGGGALPKMVPAFRLGLGGRLGSGAQWMSWIAIDDLVGAVRHVLATETIHGPVNLATPQPVTNAEFTTALGRVLRRPAIFPVPTVALRALFGQMAEDVLLVSHRAEPAVLTASGYRFQYPAIEPALRHILNG